MAKKKDYTIRNQEDALRAAHKLMEEMVERSPHRSLRYTHLHIQTAAECLYQMRNAGCPLTQEIINELAWPEEAVDFGMDTDAVEGWAAYHELQEMLNSFYVTPRRPEPTAAHVLHISVEERSTLEAHVRFYDALPCWHPDNTSAAFLAKYGKQKEPRQRRWEEVRF